MVAAEGRPSPGHRSEPASTLLATAMRELRAFRSEPAVDELQDRVIDLLTG